MKAKTIFATDLLLILTFIPSCVTGFMLHWAGHYANHVLWHNWAVAHVISTLLLTALVVIHVYGHWGWYKSLVKSGTRNKSKITMLLSVLMIAVTITGVVLLFSHDDANTGVGLWHYVLGIIVSIVIFGHFVKRHRLMIKGLKR